MWPNPQFPAGLVKCTEEILNGKRHFIIIIIIIIIISTFFASSWIFSNSGIVIDLLTLTDAVESLPFLIVFPVPLGCQVFLPGLQAVTFKTSTSAFQSVSFWSIKLFLLRKVP